MHTHHRQRRWCGRAGQTQPCQQQPCVAGWESWCVPRPLLPCTSARVPCVIAACLIAKTFLSRGWHHAVMPASCGDGASSVQKTAAANPRRAPCMSCVECQQTPRSVKGRDVLECTSPRCNTLVSLPALRGDCAATVSVAKARY